MFRQVSITGTYATDDQVLIRNRSNHGSPGYWVVTPLRTRDGEAVAVNRGWIPIQTGDEASAGVLRAAPGPVTVTGLVVDSQEQSGLGVTDPRRRAVGDPVARRRPPAPAAGRRRPVPHVRQPRHPGSGAGRAAPRAGAAARADRRLAPQLHRAVVHLRGAHRDRVPAAAPPDRPQQGGRGGRARRPIPTDHRARRHRAGPSGPDDRTAARSTGSTGDGGTELASSVPPR